MNAQLVALLLGISLFQACTSWETHGRYRDSKGRKENDYHVPSYRSYDEHEYNPMAHDHYEHDYINHYRNSKSKSYYYDDEKLWVQNLNDNRNDNQDDTRSENESKNDNINMNDLLALIEKLKHGDYNSHY
ncbi:hypothetical protein BpHYR1_009781 [Brachionus plicatilis]|uniref:Uncharacterized protein n=1 Tax=Brachionus plicatilis TaxID=10195 RepID=A0A3M7P175_BRAPC|nr:hypothetical protein BpHYR1_009781 [Brachionus plicatilis]